MGRRGWMWVRRNSCGLSPPGFSRACGAGTPEELMRASPPSGEVITAPSFPHPATCRSHRWSAGKVAYPLVKLEAVELRRIHMSLVAPFETSFGVQDERDILILKAITS